MEYIFWGTLSDLSRYSRADFKSANAVYNILGLDETNKIIARVFGQKVIEDEGGKAETPAQENQ